MKKVHATDADGGSNGLVRYTRIIGDAVMQVSVSISIIHNQPSLLSR